MQFLLILTQPLPEKMAIKNPLEANFCGKKRQQYLDCCLSFLIFTKTLQDWRLVSAVLFRE